MQTGNFRTFVISTIQLSKQPPIIILTPEGELPGKFYYGMGLL
jgi:hypothetical protein